MCSCIDCEVASRWITAHGRPSGDTHEKGRLAGDRDPVGLGPDPDSLATETKAQRKAGPRMGKVGIDIEGARSCP